MAFTLDYNHNCLLAEVELEGIQERYIQVLRSYLQHTAPNNPGRLGELLAHIPEVSLHNSQSFLHILSIQFDKRVITNVISIHFFFFVAQIQAAASLLLESKMFYVPFVLNSASVR